jgi:TatD DNase family protein
MNSTVELVDSHCHLDFESFDEDREQVLANAAEAGIKRLINPGINLETSERAVALAQQYRGVYAAVGYHPYDASEINGESLTALSQLTEQPKVVAIGEIGLDYYRDRAPRVDQIRAFEAQLDLAKSLELPVIIHQREAAADTMAILRRWGAGRNHPGLVLHAFSGDEKMVEEAVALGFYIGIGGPITFKNAKGLPDIVQAIPLSHMIIETDAPFLSPHPYRGKRNEPARLVLIAQKLAHLFGLSLEVLAGQFRRNTEALFHLPTT